MGIYIYIIRNISYSPCGVEQIQATMHCFMTCKEGTDGPALTYEMCKQAMAEVCQPIVQDCNAICIFTYICVRTMSIHNHGLQAR